MEGWWGGALLYCLAPVGVSPGMNLRQMAIWILYLRYTPYYFLKIRKLEITVEALKYGEKMNNRDVFKTQFERKKTLIINGRFWWTVPNTINIKKKIDFLMRGVKTWKWSAIINEYFGFSSICPYWPPPWASGWTFLRCWATHERVGLLEKWLTQCTLN